MAGYNHLTGHIRPVFLFLALLVSSLSPRPGNAQVAALPVATLTIGHHKVNAEIAATDATREHGLMGRKALAPDHSMLFVFDPAAAPRFWMKNTPLPLPIAFIPTGGPTFSIALNEPIHEADHCPAGHLLNELEH